MYIHTIYISMYVIVCVYIQIPQTNGSSFSKCSSPMNLRLYFDTIPLSVPQRFLLLLLRHTNTKKNKTTVLEEP